MQANPIIVPDRAEAPPAALVAAVSLHAAKSLPTQTTTFGQIGSELDSNGWDDVELYVADPAFRMPLAGLGEVRKVARVEWLTRYERCDECTDGVVELENYSHLSSRSINRGCCSPG